MQGAFALHQRSLESLGARTVQVRTAADLARVDALVVPGGESSTISMLLERSALLEPVAERLAGGMAAFGTCAGAILLGTDKPAHILGPSVTSRGVVNMTALAVVEANQKLQYNVKAG